MVSFMYNSSQIIGQTIDGATTNITGSIFLTVLALIILLLVIGVIFRIDYIWVITFIVPVVLVIIAFGNDVGIGSEFNVIGILVGIFLAILLARNWFLDVR